MELKKRYYLFIVVLLLLIFLFGCSPVNIEQERGKIKGIVVDENNQPKEEATITIIDVGGEPGNMKGNIVKETETDSEGKFEAELEVGNYLIEAWYGTIDNRNKEPAYADIFENHITEVTLELSANECIEMQGCEQFNCLFLDCWCDELVENPIHSSGRKVAVVKDAKEVVEGYFEKNPDESKAFYNSVYLGNGWFNLFYEDDEEKVYTVGPKGNVYIIQCGV